MAIHTEEEKICKSFGIRVAVDLSCIASVALPTLLINVLAHPFHRGFFCDDQSLKHPFKEDTVPLWLLVIMAVGLPILSFLVVELLLPKISRCCVPLPSDLSRGHKNVRLEACYRTIILFLFGVSITQLVTEIAKYSLGRLRPHFLEVCKPHGLAADCSSVFIVEDVCTGDNAAIIREARLSFLSGHASMAMFTSSFLIIYLQARLLCIHAKLVRTVFQVFVFCLAFFTCLSRISDYKHHWSDVLAGGLLGIISCYLIVISLGDFHNPYLRPRLLSAHTFRKDRLPMHRQEVQSSSSSEPVPNSTHSIQVYVENHKL